MNDLILRFKLMGFPVTVQPIFWLVALMLARNAQGVEVLMWIGLVFASILVHELGHALAARAMGMGATIELTGTGGLTHTRGARSRGQSLRLAIAGPLAGFAVGVPLLLLSWTVPLPGLLGRFVAIAVWINITWGLFNLLPVSPLDGGHVAESLLPSKTSAWLSVGVAALVVLYGFVSSDLFLVVMFGALGWFNLQRAQA